MAAADITDLLDGWSDGDRDAGNSLIASICPTLRGIAQKQLRHASGGATLLATERVSRGRFRPHLNG